MPLPARNYGMHGRLAGWWRLRDLIASRSQIVTGGAFSGGPVTPGASIDRGQLSDSYWPCLSHADYIIWSFETPIAWHTTDSVWHQPHERYSVTTLRHQSQCAVAIAELHNAAPQTRG